jgi:integrase
LKSVDAERHLFSKWLAPLHDIPLPRITTAHLDGVVSTMRQAGKAPATVKYALAVVSQVWNHAALLDVVSGESPTRKVKKPQIDNRRTRFLVPEEARTLLEALRTRSVDTHDEAILALFCGMRAGEIHALAWSDVDLNNGTLLLRDTKSGKNRHVFICPEVEAMLLRRGAENKTGLVFPAVGGGLRKWVSDTFSRVVEELGFNSDIADARQHVVFHTLRHTFASWLVQRGVPLYTVAQLLGHSTLEMTQRYAHLAPDSVRAAALGLAGALDEPKTAVVVPFKKAARS